MKFKVGDKVRIVSEGQIFPHYKEKFDELANNINLALWEYGFSSKLVNGTIVTIRALDNKEEIALVEGYFEGKECSLLIGFEGIEFVESQTEFTFKEVVARNIPGIYMNCSDAKARVKNIIIRKDGSLGIDANFRGIVELGIVGINHNLKFKLQEPKKRVTIYKVEHKKDGKKYDFISSQRLHIEMFVVCDTCQGKSYGRIVDLEERELTGSEIKQFKECWRA